MIAIEEVKGREILESRGLPTIEVQIRLSNDITVKASSPSGTSYGIEENVEVRDKDMSRYHGYGVLRAIEKINKTIAPRLYKKDPQDQFTIDELLSEIDGTPNKANLGSNTILAVSMAVAKAGAQSKKLALFEYLNELYQKQYNYLYKKEDEEKSVEERSYTRPINKMKMPEPVFNIINGRDSENSKLDFQDFMVMFKGTKEYEQKLRYASELVHHIEKIVLDKNYFFTILSNEGGFTPDIASDKKGLELIMEAIQKLDRVASSVYIGLDVAATGLYDNMKKVYKLKCGKKELTAVELTDYYLKLQENFPIIFLEDPFAANDFKSWKYFMQKAPANIGIVGDDLFNSSLSRALQNGKEMWANAIVIKPNQVGSLLDILNLTLNSQQQGLKVMFSHRSGETNDDYLSDLSVALGADYIKAGSPRFGERVAKYNRLLDIKDKLSIIQKTEF